MTLKPLTLIGRSDQKFADGTYKWKAICGCGVEFLTKKRNVELGQTKSCGCYRRLASRSRRLLASENRPVNESTIKPTSFYRYKESARFKKLDFTLTYSDFEFLVEKPCYYCGQIKGLINGIDRLDSDEGYTTKNCVPCCTECNYFKAAIDFDTFKGIIKLIYLNLVKHGDI